MNKQYAVISCPIFTLSGYGKRSYDFVKAVYELKKDEWDIEILPQRWGSTPWIDPEQNEEYKWLIPLINKSGQLPKQPDFWCQITVPNEAQPIGKYNVMVTAGIETTICAPQWIDGINRMDLTLVSSEHSKRVLTESSFEEKNPQGQVVRRIRTEKPVEVIFEGLDLNKYFFIDDTKEESELPQTELVESLDSIKEDFCFLFVGHWLNGEFGEDRKNVGLTIHTFLDTFKNKKKRPALVLKTSSGGASIMDRDAILEKIDAVRKSFGTENLPNIYLIHGELDDSDINNLYNHSKIKAMVNLTKGEGFGRPILEFTASKKPLIASFWSGHTDFLDPEFYLPIPGELKPLHPSTVVPDMLLAESSWFSPNVAAAKKAMEDVYNDYSTYEAKAKRQARKTNTEFSYDKMKAKLDEYLARVPKQVQLVLPKLKKIELPKLKKI
jgi:glycosyltransferase involved in cell wall biosynthesis